MEAGLTGIRQGTGRESDMELIGNWQRIGHGADRYLAEIKQGSDDIAGDLCSLSKERRNDNERIQLLCTD